MCPYHSNRQKTTTDTLLNRLKVYEDKCYKDTTDCFSKLLSVTINTTLVRTISLSKKKDENEDAIYIDLNSNIIPAIITSCRNLLYRMVLCIFLQYAKSLLRMFFVFNNKIVLHYIRCVFLVFK